jgi:hypothetical protein
MTRIVKLNMHVSLNSYSLLKAADAITATDEELAMWSTFSLKPHQDAVQIGTAEVTITMLEHKDIVLGQVATLEQLKKHVQAEAQRRVTLFDQQIQSLLALENK